MRPAVVALTILGLFSNPNPQTATQDTTPPAIDLDLPFLSPVHDFNPACSPVTYDGWASDDVGISSVTWANDRGESGTALTYYGYGAQLEYWSLANLELQAGSTIFTVTAHDTSDNTATVTFKTTFTPTDTVSPSWTAPSETIGPLLANPGDVNGDEYNDLLFGDVRTGSATLVLGSASGPSDSEPWSFPASVYAFVAPAGDVNGDGFDDVIVGSPPSASAYGTPTPGHAYLFAGSPSGLSLTPIWIAEKLTRGGASGFGHLVHGAGDLDGDGYDDVVVTDDVSATGSGQIYVYSGSPTGPTHDPTWILDVGSGGYPHAVAQAAGDLNRDGFDDLVVPVYPGYLWIFLGSREGLASSPDQVLRPGSEPDYDLAAEAAGDVNGDGFGDLLVSCSACFTTTAWSGAAIVYYGSPNGLLPDVAWQVNGGFLEAFFGYHSHAAGDVNADGYDDVIVGESHTFCDGLERVHLYLGSPQGLSSRADLSWKAPDYLALPAGDINGDGAADLALNTAVYYGVPTDRDSDGFTPRGGDCDDHNPAIHPGAIDLPGNLVDENCDGTRSCDPSTTWLNHGAFVGCVSRECDRLVTLNLVGVGQCSALISRAAHAVVGKPRPRRLTQPPEEP